MTIIIGAIAGWLAEKVMKADMGLLMNIIIVIFLFSTFCRIRIRR